MTKFAVITKVGKGNYACSEIVIDPTADKHVAGANIIVGSNEWTDEMFANAIKTRNNKQSVIDLTKKQMLFCNTPVFNLGEILVMDSNGRTISDGRKPSKWDVVYEYFDDIEFAIARSKEVVGEK